MTRAIVRHGHKVTDDGRIIYDDRPVPVETLDHVAGVRLDRRKNWALVEGHVCDSASWSQTCSGCEGGGCRECGFHGVTRRSMWVPWTPSRDSED